MSTEFKVIMRILIFIGFFVVFAMGLPKEIAKPVCMFWAISCFFAFIGKSNNWWR